MRLLPFLPLLASLAPALASIAYDGASPYPLTEQFGKDYLKEMQELVSRVEQDKGLNWTQVATELHQWRNRAMTNAKIWKAQVSSKTAHKSSTSKKATTTTASGATTTPSSPTTTSGGVTLNQEAQVATTTPSTINTVQTTGISLSYSPPALTPLPGAGAPPTTTSNSLGTSTTSSSTAASSPATSSASPGPEDTADQAMFLALHNTFRAEYGANNVVWNDTLAAYAYKAASTCKYGHTGGPYGENIAAGVGGGYNLTKGFATWSDEYKLYNWSAPGYSDATGHFTQIVWKGTTQIGCAAQTCADNTIFQGYRQNSLYLVCEYAEPGNWVDPNSAAATAQYFTENVGTATGTGQ